MKKNAGLIQQENHAQHAGTYLCQSGLRQNTVISGIAMSERCLHHSKRKLTTAHSGKNLNFRLDIIQMIIMQQGKTIFLLMEEIMPYCSSCGRRIPEGQGKSCSICYGDIDYGRDGYYREWAERQQEDDNQEIDPAEERG